MSVPRLENADLKTRLLVSFIAGSFSALAMAPYNFFPALFISLSLLYVLTAFSRSPTAAFFTGWAFGFGYFVFGLYWVGNALLIEGNPYFWAWPLAVCGLPFVLAFFPAFACLLARRFTDLKTISGFLAFAAYAAFFEWARGHVLTGFPWNLYGHTWAGILPILQVLSFSDVYFLTFLTVLWASVTGFFFVGETSKKQKIFLGAILAASFAFCFAFGVWRLGEPSPESRNADIHLVQANIPQSEKWNRDKVWDHLEKRIRLSRPEIGASDRPVYIVWPETALSQWTLEVPQTQLMIRELLNLYKGPAYLLTGLLRHDAKTNRYYNSLVLIDKRGAVSNVYDKNHLVPFGEYIPFQKWIPLEPVAKFSGFSGGGSPQTYQTPEGLKYSPMICYEIIFSGAVIDQNDRPDFILNVTNDSWYGFSAGPHQHLAQAVFRAIEEGLPVIRAADTGFSAIIDPYGRIIGKSELYNEYEKTLALPGSIMVSRNNGLYKQIAFITLILVFAISGYRRRKKY